LKRSVLSRGFIHLGGREAAIAYTSEPSTKRRSMGGGYCRRKTRLAPTKKSTREGGEYWGGKGYRRVTIVNFTGSSASVSPIAKFFFRGTSVIRGPELSDFERGRSKGRPYVASSLQRIKKRGNQDLDGKSRLKRVLCPLSGRALTPGSCPISGEKNLKVRTGDSHMEIAAKVSLFRRYENHVLSGRICPSCREG